MRYQQMAALLLGCACERFGDACPTRACVVPGVEVAIENCCQGDQGGQLTVNIVRAYPSREFPIASTGVPGNCDDPYTVVDFRVQIARCAPVGHGRVPPSCEQLEATALRIHDDMELIRDGVSCCLKSKPAEVLAVAGRGYRWSLGDHLTVGPEGGCVGSNLQVLIGMGNCLECP